MVDINNQVIKKRIEVNLTQEEMKFLLWLSQRDNVSLKKELQQLFYLQLREEMDLYLEESKIQ